MMSPDDVRRIEDSFRSARAARWFGNLLVPRHLRENVWGDLREDYAARFPSAMPRHHARRWLFQQLLTAAPRFVICRLRTEVSISTWLTLLISTVLGLALAYVESRPNWDDTGVLVSGIVISAAMLGWFGSGPYWLMALTAGSWIPLHDIPVIGAYASLMAIVFAFAGTYTGAVMRRAIAGSRRST